jgi:hypothetical protein
MTAAQPALQLTTAFGDVNDDAALVEQGALEWGRSDGGDDAKPIAQQRVQAGAVG